MRATNKLSMYRVAALVMPVLAVVAVAVMGTALLRPSHALTSGEVSNTPAIATGVDLPTSAITACCRLETISLSTKTGTTERVTTTVRVHNITNTTLQLSPGLQFNLIDTSGGSHPYTAAYVSPETTIGGPLAAGKTTTLTLDFDLAPSESARYIEFQADAGSQQVQVGLPQ
jgi:hypothetical protein